MHEFGAGGVAEGAAVVDGRVPVGETDEKDGVERLGGLGVAEPDRFSPLFAAGTHPRSEPAHGLAVVDDHRLDEEVLPREEKLPAGLRRGDRCRCHQFRHLANRVGAETVVVTVLGHGIGSASVGGVRRAFLPRVMQPWLHN